jgi:hypothetical protein
MESPDLLEAVRDALLTRVADLRDELAGTQATLSTVVSECEAYRVLAQLSIHRIQELTVQNDRLRQCQRRSFEDRVQGRDDSEELGAAA